MLVVGIAGIAGCRVDGRGAGTISGCSRFAIAVARISILLSNNPSSPSHLSVEYVDRSEIAIISHNFP